MSETEVRLVPRPPQSSIAMLELAEEQGWRAVAEPEDGWDDQVVAAYALADGTVALWHEDDLTGLGYVTVGGPSAPAVDALVRTRLDVLEPGDFRSFVERQPRAQDIGHALYAVSLANPGRTATNEVEAILLRALDSDDPTVRRYALLGASLVPTSTLEDRFIELAASDPDEDARETALIVLDDLGLTKHDDDAPHDGRQVR